MRAYLPCAHNPLIDPQCRRRQARPTTTAAAAAAAARRAGRHCARRLINRAACANGHCGPIRGAAIRHPASWSSEII